VKKFISGCLVMSMLFLITTAFAMNKQIKAQFESIKLKINGKIIDTGKDEPFIYNGRTYIPARYIAEGLGATVTWDAKGKIIEVTSGSAPVTPTVTPTSIPTPTVTPTPTPVISDMGYYPGSISPKGDGGSSFIVLTPTPTPLAGEPETIFSDTNQKLYLTHIAKFTYKGKLGKFKIFENNTECVAICPGGWGGGVIRYMRDGYKYKAIPKTSFTGDFKAKREFSILVNPSSNTIESVIGTDTDPFDTVLQKIRTRTNVVYTGYNPSAKRISVENAEVIGVKTTEYKLWDSTLTTSITKTFLHGGYFTVIDGGSDKYHRQVPLEDLLIDLLGVTDYKTENVN
jgi:hypothetical protein